MPRSYSFDHFTAMKPDVSKTEAAGGNHHPVKSETPMPEPEGLHYGRQHAETVAWAQARRMDREAEQRLTEETQMMDEQPPAEPVEAADSPSPETELAPPREPSPKSRRRVAAKRAPAQRKRAKRAPAAKRASSKKEEHHTSVARRPARKAASSRKKAATRPARKTTRGTKQLSRAGAMARTGRGGKRPTAKKTAIRGTARRAPKRR
jgi:hypothetical protein